MKRAHLVAMAVGVALTGACAKKIEMKMAVDVLSEPEKAEVKFRNKALGQAPRSLNIVTFDDLEAITATAGADNVIEKRVRILTPEKAQLIFRFGKEPSPLAKKLGATRLLVFEYAERVSFDTSKFDLKPDARPILDRQKDILNGYFPNAKVYVCGYTDSTGGDDLNSKLSLDRANAVRAYLSSGANPVPAARLEPRGFGKDFPQDDNATSAGRAANRRTEIVLPQ
jgi:outer membrane protein OmpA-like peptidoglycan-associated protein